MAGQFDRRGFLKAAVATAGLLALPAAVKLVQSDEPPDLLTDALKQAKSENKVLLVVLVPQSRLAPVITQDLVNQLESGEPDARRIFCSTIFTCLSAPEAARHFPKHVPDGRVLCVSAAQESLGECEYSDALFKKRFGTALAKLVAGKDSARLMALAQSQRDALDTKEANSFDSALQQLSAKDYQTRAAASGKLEELAARTTALLWKAQADSKDPEVVGRIAEIFTKLFLSAPSDKNGPRVPYGFGSPRGRWTRFYDACPGCGMGVIFPNARLFIRGLTGGLP